MYELATFYSVEPFQGASNRKIPENWTKYMLGVNLKWQTGSTHSWNTCTTPFATDHRGIGTINAKLAYVAPIPRNPGYSTRFCCLA